MLAQQGGWELVFLGDSITHGWERNGKSTWDKYYGARKAINLGFGGDRTEHVLWRLEHGEFDGYKPRVAVIMIGTNNTGHDMQPQKQSLLESKRLFIQSRKNLLRQKFFCLEYFHGEPQLMIQSE